MANLFREMLDDLDNVDPLLEAVTKAERWHRALVEMRESGLNAHAYISGTEEALNDWIVSRRIGWPGGTT